MKPIKDDKEMKKYIKPSMELVDVELTAMFLGLSGNDSGYDSEKPILTNEEKDWNDGSFWGE